MKTRTELLNELYYAIKQNYGKRMDSLVAIQRATNLTARVEQDKTKTCEDIQKMIYTFLKGDKLELPKKFKTEINKTWNGRCWVWSIKQEVIS